MKNFIKKFIIIAIFIIIGYTMSSVLSYHSLTSSEKEIKSLTYECLQYNDSKDKCSKTAITQVAEEIQMKDNQ